MESYEFSDIIPEQNRQLMEKLTRDQTDVWLRARHNRITSTKVKDICTSNNPDITALKILIPPDLSHLPYVSRGKADEQQGVDYLMYHLGEEATAFRVGLVLHPQHTWFGASPDRLVKHKNNWFLLEVKNWYQTSRQKTLKDLPYLDKNLKLKKNHSHYYQIQTAMLVCGVKSCFFVVHGSQSLIQEVEFDEAFSAECTDIIVSFFYIYYKQHFQSVNETIADPILNI